MDKGRYGSRGKLLSWALAVLLIAAGAIVIGWFAGEGLMALMNRGEGASPLDELGTEGTGEALDVPAEEIPAVEAQTGETETPSVELPSVASGQAETGNGRSSPFETPPWMSDNLSIKPIEGQPAEGTAAEGTAAEGQEAEVAAEGTGAPAEETTAPEALEPTDQSQKIPELYKVRVGPYQSMAEASAAAQELVKLGFPTLITLAQKYYVQIGAFSSRTNAENLEAKVEGYGYSATIFD